ncbi:MAG: hypothetical protein J3K34DRAFT_404699 [Monoraphidium minutum]|nr:MAG: hypothetical protein J3K34DRAFT_404699 [Monoraphidium minutum]
MGLPLPEQQARQLVAALVERRQGAAPQHISNTLWAAATMGLPLPEQSWERLLAALAAKARQAAPQNVSNALWAAAKRKAEPAAAAAHKSSVTAVEAALLQLAAAVSREQVARYNAQDVSNSLWALSELRLRPPAPTALLAEAALQRAPAMAPQALSNTALALARLGVHDARLFAALVGAAVQQQQQLGAQDTANLAWAAAVAHQQQLSGAVAGLCGQLARNGGWGSIVAEAHWKLWQVHLWLQDGQPAAGSGDGGGGGLARALSAAQLQQCAAAWEASLQQRAQQRRSELEQRVFECARRLPCLADCRQEACTPDGAFSVDVPAAHAASGRRLAIEADGPTHFLRPGREPTGDDTLARNRALAARGFVVVSVPWWEWREVRGAAAAQDSYLLRKVEAAVSGRQEGARPRRRQGDGAGGSGGGGARAAAAASEHISQPATAHTTAVWHVSQRVAFRAYCRHSPKGPSRARLLHAGARCCAAALLPTAVEPGPPLSCPGKASHSYPRGLRARLLTAAHGPGSPVILVGPKTQSNPFFTPPPAWRALKAGAPAGRDVTTRSYLILSNPIISSPHGALQRYST